MSKRTRLMTGAGLMVVVVGAAAVCMTGWCADAEKGVAVVKYAQLEAAVKEHRGKVVLVDFWATWCPPCVKKFPMVVELHRTYADKGLVCLAVSLDDPKDGEKVRQFLDEKGAKFPGMILRNPTKADDEALEKHFGYTGGIPHMVLFDRKGEKVWDTEAAPLPKEGAADKLDKMVKAELGK